MVEAFSGLLSEALHQVARFGVAVLQAVVVLAIAVVVAGTLRRWTRRRIRQALIPENGKTLVENGLTVAVYVAAITILLAIWGVSWSSLLAAIGVSTIVVALGLQVTLQSFVGGILVLFERPYNVGDRIWYSKGNIDGTVEEIGLRTTVLRSEDGNRIIVPNSFVHSEAVVNNSPDRARLTIITIKPVDPKVWTAAEVQAAIDAKLSGIPGLDVRPRTEMRQRFTVLTKLESIRPAILRRAVIAVEDFAFAYTTQVKVIWAGSAKSATREEVVRRLKEVFPESRIDVRRW
jgi:small-conductance mechanosensitive channel